MKNDVKRFKSGAIWSVGNSVLKTLVSVFITYLILKKLSVEDYGIFNLILVIIGYFQLVAVPGLLQIIRRFIPEFIEHKDYYGVHYFLKSFIIKVIWISFFILVLFYLFSNPIGDFFSVENLWEKFKYAYYFIPFYFIGLIFNQLFNSLLFQKYLTLINFSTEIVRAIIIVSLFLIDVRLEWVLLGQGFSWFFSALLYIIFYWRKFASKYKRQFEIKKYEKKRYYSFGVYTYFNELGAKVLNASTDYFIIGAYLGPVSIGYYAFANKVITIIGNLLPNRMMKAPITSFFYSLYSKDQVFANLQNRFNLVLKFNIFFVAPVVMALFVYGEYFVNYLFGDKYEASIDILYVFAFFMLTKTITHPLGLVLTALEDVKIILYSKIISFINIAFAIVLVNYYGVIGVAFATCFSILLKDMIIYVYTWRKYHLSLPVFGVFKILLSSLSIVLLGYFTLQNTSNILLVLCSLVVAIIATYWIILKLAIDKSEYAMLTKGIRSK